MDYILEMVKCSQLKLDLSYQREAEERDIKPIVKDWDDDQVRPLVLSLRENGDLYIVDGNHTKTGALIVKGDDTELPAKIYTDLTVTKEAELFVKLNSNSKKVSFNEKLKAKVTAQDPEAIDYTNALNESGIPWKYKASGNRGYFIGHSGGMRFLKRYGHQKFVEALRTLAIVDDKNLFDVAIVGGLCKILQDTKVESSSLINTLKKVTKDEIQKKS